MIHAATSTIVIFFFLLSLSFKLISHSSADTPPDFLLLLYKETFEQARNEWQQTAGVGVFVFGCLCFGRRVDVVAVMRSSEKEVGEGWGRRG